jgi:hypothetical protein
LWLPPVAQIIAYADASPSGVLCRHADRHVDRFRDPACDNVS